MIARRTCIGVFDSGFGGLTVLKALLRLLPDADYLYFGDTARLPYGSKSAETVARYAVGAAHYLEQQGAQTLVIACNTATALALDKITQAASVPVLGVISLARSVPPVRARTRKSSSLEPRLPSAAMLICARWKLAACRQRRKPAPSLCLWWRRVGSIIP